MSVIEERLFDELVFSFLETQGIKIRTLYLAYYQERTVWSVWQWVLAPLSSTWTEGTPRNLVSKSRVSQSSNTQDDKNKSELKFDGFGHKATEFLQFLQASKFFH